MGEGGCSRPDTDAMKARVRLEAYQIEQIPASRVPNLGWFLDPAARRGNVLPQSSRPPCRHYLCFAAGIYVRSRHARSCRATISGGEQA